MNGTTNLSRGSRGSQPSTTVPGYVTSGGEGHPSWHSDVDVLLYTTVAYWTGGCVLCSAVYGRPPNHIRTRSV